MCLFVTKLVLPAVCMIRAEHGTGLHLSMVARLRRMWNSRQASSWHGRSVLLQPALLQKAVWDMRDGCADCLGLAGGSLALLARQDKLGQRLRASARMRETMYLTIQELPRPG